MLRYRHVFVLYEPFEEFAYGSIKRSVLRPLNGHFTEETTAIYYRRPNLRFSYSSKKPCNGKQF